MITIRINKRSMADDESVDAKLSRLVARQTLNTTELLELVAVKLYEIRYPDAGLLLRPKSNPWIHFPILQAVRPLHLNCATCGILSGKLTPAITKPRTNTCTA